LEAWFENKANARETGAVAAANSQGKLALLGFSCSGALEREKREGGSSVFWHV
jgi:hypothetical protein